MQKTERIVLLLVLVQAVSVVMLWSLISLTRVSQEVFTLFLGVDLLSLALVSRVYRAEKAGESVRRFWIVFAGVVILLLLFGTLFLS